MVTADLATANRRHLFDGGTHVPVPELYQDYAQEAHCRRCRRPKPRPLARIVDGELEVLLICDSCGAFVRL